MRNKGNNPVTCLGALRARLWTNAPAGSGGRDPRSAAEPTPDRARHGGRDPARQSFVATALGVTFIFGS